MTKKEINALRQEFIHGQSKILADIFTQNADHCIQRLIRSKKCRREDAEDIFVEAIINFRQKVISGKIDEIQNLNAYLWGTCQNMFRKLAEKETRVKKIREAERLPLDHFKDYNIDEEYVTTLHKIGIQSLEKLSEKCQRLLKMFYVMELSMNEIAEELDFANADVAKTTKSRCFKQWMKEARILKREAIEK